MRFLISTLVAICAATSANACGFMGQPPCAPVAPIQPHFPTTIMPMGGGSYLVNTPGRMPTTIMPLGGGAYSINTPGQMPRNCLPLGGGMTSCM
jgi:hypothetical protein